MVSRSVSCCQNTSSLPARVRARLTSCVSRNVKSVRVSCWGYMDRQRFIAYMKSREVASVSTQKFCMLCTNG